MFVYILNFNPPKFETNIKIRIEIIYRKKNSLLFRFTCKYIFHCKYGRYKTSHSHLEYKETYKYVSLLVAYKKFIIFT